MKKKIAKKQKKVRKQKSQAKKAVKARKPRIGVAPQAEPPVTLGFEFNSAGAEPVEPEAQVDLAADVIPGDPTEAV